MKSAGKRLRKCESCKGRLPAGSRVDRKYCCAACITRAYYERHPEKKRVLSSRTRKQVEAETRAVRRSNEAASQLAQLEAENVQLRQQNADLRAALQTRPPVQAATPMQTLALNEAERRIAQLTVTAREATTRAEQAEQRLLKHQHRIAELEKQPRAETSRTDRTVQSHEQNKSQHKTAPSPIDEADSYEPLPWEWRPKPGQPAIPKWMGWDTDTFEPLREFSQEIQKTIPTEIYNQGERNLSRQMRDWFTEPTRVEYLTELSFRIVLITVCTDRAQRRKQSQKEQLAAQALHRAIETMEVDHPSDAQEIKAAMEEDEDLFKRLALELVCACRGEEVKFSLRKGRWYRPGRDSD